MKNMPFFPEREMAISRTVKWPFLFSVKRDLGPLFIILLLVYKVVATDKKSREKKILLRYFYYFL